MSSYLPSTVAKSMFDADTFDKSKEYVCKNKFDNSSNK